MVSGGKRIVVTYMTIFYTIKPWSMRKKFYTSFIFLSAILSAAIVTAQKDRFAYAITDVSKEGVNWSYLRRIDLTTGSFSDVLLSGTDFSQLSFDATTKKQMRAPLTDTRFGSIVNAAFGTGVAALAYDKRNNRLYYTPMFVDQLRYIDLKSMKVYFINDADLTGTKVKAADQSNIVTRMAIASDANGYALTNDGNHLIRFTTGKKTTITDIGALIDNPSNNNSIHNSCSSYGGDMIADDDGNLYVFSARNHVFKVNIETRIASHLGTIKSLPENFTVNGAAVDDNGLVLLTSAVNNTALYTLDINTLEAKSSASNPFRSSDLANSNLLATKRNVPIAALIKNTEEISNGKIQLYPNPVRGNHFRLQFLQEPGNYTVQVTDVLGRQATHAIINISGKGQTEMVQLPVETKQGVYLVKVIDHNDRTVFSKKILVQ